MHLACDYAASEKRVKTQTQVHLIPMAMLSALLLNYHAVLTLPWLKGCQT